MDLGAVVVRVRTQMPGATHHLHCVHHPAPGLVVRPQMREDVGHKQIPQRRQVHGVGPDGFVVERERVQQADEVSHVGVRKERRPLLLRLHTLHLRLEGGPNPLVDAVIEAVQTLRAVEHPVRHHKIDQNRLRMDGALGAEVVLVRGHPPAHGLLLLQIITRVDQRLERGSERIPGRPVHPTVGHVTPGAIVLRILLRELGFVDVLSGIPNVRANELRRGDGADGDVLKRGQRSDGQLWHPERFRAIPGAEGSVVEPTGEIERHVHEAVHIVQALIRRAAEDQGEGGRLDCTTT